MTEKKPATKVAKKPAKKVASPVNDQTYKARKVKRVVGPYPNVPPDPIGKIEPGEFVETTLNFPEVHMVRSSWLTTFGCAMFWAIVGFVVGRTI